MSRKTKHDEGARNQFWLPKGIVLKPPVGLDDLKADTENDPLGAEEFVALIRALRREGSRQLAL